MGFFTRAAMRVGVSVTGMGLAGARAVFGKTTTIEELESAVGRLQQTPPKPPLFPASITSRKHETRSVLDRLAPEHKERILAKLARKDVDGVVAELKMIKGERLPFAVQSILDRPSYSDSDIEQMTAAAAAVAKDVVDRTSRFEKPLATSRAKTVSERGEALRKALTGLDAKYASVKPELIKQRIREYLAESFFANLPTLDEKALRSVGLDDAHVQKAMALKAELALEAAAAKAAEKAKKEGKSVPEDLGAAKPGTVRLGIDIMRADDGDFAIRLDPNSKSKAAITLGANLSRLGLNAANFGENAIGVMNDALNKREAAMRETVRDGLIVLRTSHQKFVKMFVDFARMKGLEPLDFVQGMAQLQRVVRASDSLLAAGQDAWQKAKDVPAIQAMLLLVVDELLLGPGSIGDNAKLLIEDPRLEKALTDIMRSPELRAIGDDIGASFERFERMLER